jgi:pimeloyl-ACP methyl ester carboxylesterase
VTATVSAGGHRLAVERLGRWAPGEPVLVFLHEGLGSISMWKDFPVALAAAAGLPALVYDRYGHGRSDPLEAPRAADFLEREATIVLPELLALEGITRPVLVGHSDGGSIALLHAATFPDSPVACVTLAAHVLFEPAMRAGVGGVRERFRTDPELRRRLGRHHRDVDRLVEDWTGIWLAPDRPEWTMVDKLAAITCPVLVLQGERDEHGTAVHVDAIRAGVGGRVETLVLKGVGHVPHLDAGDQVVAAITRFLAPADDRQLAQDNPQSCRDASS